MNPTELSNNDLSSPREPFTPESDTSGADFSSLGRNRRVLIVDDNVVVLKAFETKLKSSGFQVVLARDPASAVAVARTQKPDLIVLDINFAPDESFTSLQWNGLTVLQWLKRLEELAEIPVVVISADDPAKHKSKAMAAGAVAYFQKPMDFKEFAAALQPLLDRRASVAINHEI